MNDPIYKGAYIVGNGKSPVIISTSGKVVVKVNDKYFPINYSEINDSSKSTKDEEDKELPLKIVSPEEVSTLAGTLTEDTLIVSTEGKLYLVHNKILTELKLSMPTDYVANSITTNKLIVRSAEVVPLLNASYLQGVSASELLKKSESATLSGNLSFSLPITIAGLNGQEIDLNAKTGYLKLKKLVADEIILNQESTEEYDFQSKNLTFGRGTSNIISASFKKYEQDDGTSYIRYHIVIPDAFFNQFEVGEEIIYMTENKGPVKGLLEGKIPDSNELIIILEEPFPETAEEQEAFAINKEYPIYQPLSKNGFAGRIGYFDAYFDGSAKLGREGHIISVTPEGKVTISGITDELQKMQLEIDALKNVVNNLQS